jgi:hypothetical protein
MRNRFIMLPMLAGLTGCQGSQAANDALLDQFTYALASATAAYYQRPPETVCYTQQYFNQMQTICTQRN